VRSSATELVSTALQAALCGQLRNFPLKKIVQLTLDETKLLDLMQTLTATAPLMISSKNVTRFLLSFTAVVVLSKAASAVEPLIIDTHTHFKGAEQIAVESKLVRRHPQDTLGKVITPADYRAVANRLNIQATVIVEAVSQSDPQFNDWALAQAKSDLVCGYIARGDLTSPSFPARYQRYLKSGYLRGYRFRMDELRGYLKSKLARENLKRLQKDGMVVDLLIESRHARDVVELARSFPELNIVIDHCFRARMKDGNIPSSWEKAVRECAKFPNVSCKISSILNFTEAEPFAKPAPDDLKTYAHVLKTCYEAFGEDRIVFGTNWAVCNHYGKVDDVVKIVSTFLKSQSDTAFQKGMRDNAIRIFKIRADQMRERNQTQDAVPSNSE
jgi:L-fuconolactonase